MSSLLMVPFSFLSLAGESYFLLYYLLAGLGGRDDKHKKSSVLRLAKCIFRTFAAIGKFDAHFKTL